MKSLALLALAAAALAAPPQAVLGGEELFLVQLSPTETRWIKEDDKWELRRQGINFMDITEHRDFGLMSVKKKVTFPKDVWHNKTLHPLLKQLKADNMREHLEKFSSFHTRYYKSNYGAQSAQWLFEQVSATLEASDAPKAGAFVTKFVHPWGQPSLIATIPGKSNKTVVIGAHQDSINLFLPSILAAPGADDDGSGTVTILEALRVLLKDPVIAAGNATNTIEFHWYSAEEGGLLGSQAIFSSYEKAGRDVRAMLQQDMTGFIQRTIDSGAPESVGVITDFVDEGLTDFIKKVITAYCDIPFVETKCGYACSDHASASKAGYPSAFVIESEFRLSDNHIHGTEDLIKYLSFEHMLQHAKLTLGLVYELALEKI